MTEERLNPLQWLQSKFASLVHTHTSNQVTDLIDTIYPVGSIYMSVSNTSPSILFGGTWEQIEDTFLLASGTNYATGTTGGEATHTLTENEMPQHTHTPPTWVHYASTNGNTGNYSVTRVTANNGNTYVGSTPQVNKDVGYTGGGQAHNNMPPFLVVNVWKRTG